MNYDDEQNVHIRIWTLSGFNNFDTVVDKAQQGCDGALLITGTVDIILPKK